MLLPILLAGFVIAGLYCQKWGKSFSDGATVLSAFAAVVMYLFGVAQGWGRQRGIL